MTDRLNFQPLPDDAGITLTVATSMVGEMWEAGSEWVRVTVITPEHPHPPYPAGIYVEGWNVRPATEPPFEYPLSSIETGQ